MHVALLHEGRPALLRVEGLVGAPAALFFHPFPLDSEVWGGMLAAAARAGLCAAALDAPGFGGTPALGAPLTMDALAGLGACALDALGAQQAAVIGCSMGGYAAMAFARLFPQRVRSLALIATKAGADAPEAKAAREAQAQVALSQGAPAAIAALLGKVLSPAAPPALQAQVQGFAARATAQGVADALRGMALRPDSSEALARVQAPALVVAGADDQLMPRAELDKLAQLIPGARLAVIPGAGHLPFLEQPEQVAALLFQSGDTIPISP